MKTGKKIPVPEIVFLALFFFLTCQLIAQNGIELTGLISENEGSAGWDADGTGPEPYGNGHSTFLYYAASRDYVDINCNYGSHVTGIGTDFPAFAQALSDNGFDPGQVKLRIGLSSQGADLPGSDWFAFGSENFMNFYPIDLMVYLNDELMIKGLANYMIFHIGPSTGYEFFCTSNYFIPQDASAFSSPEVQAVAAAFLQDAGDDELKMNLQTFGTSQSFFGNGRSGSYFNFEGIIEKGRPFIPIQGLAENHEGFAGWDADGTGPEPKGNGHSGQKYYIASRDYDGIDPDPNACFVRFLDENVSGFQNFALQLEYRGFDPEQVKLKMDIRNLDEDVEGEDWTYDGTIHAVNFYHSLITAELNGELLFGFVCDTSKTYQDVTNPGLGWWGNSVVTPIFDASANSSEEIQAVAASFFKDLESRQVCSKTIKATTAPGIINTNGRMGGFWQINEAELIFTHGPGTVVEAGPVSGHWTMEGHPYVVEGEITIESGQVLDIDPGVWVKFKDCKNMMIHGTVRAIGDTSNTGSIVFTAIDPDQGWGHFLFDNVDTTNAASVFSHCIFEYGYAPPPDPPSSPFNCGGAIALRDYDNILIENCVFHHNRALNSGFYYASGGAIALWNSNPAIRNCIFRDNSAQCSGAILAAIGSSPTISNCLFINNASLMPNNYGAGAFMAYVDSHPVLLNNTFFNNHSNYRGGAVEINSTSNPVFINNIFWNNTAPQYDEICISSSNCNVNMSYNDLAGGQEGIGPYGTGTGVCENNLDTDPGFEDPLALNLKLAEGSPCIDAGIPDISGLNIPPYDLLGNLRIWDGGSGEERIDMGPYEFNAPLYLAIDNTKMQQDVRTISIYPNPVSGTATIEFELQKSSEIRLTLFDLQGRIVGMPVNGFLSKGMHQVYWDSAGLPTGIYICRIQTTHSVMTAKMIKVE